MTGDEANGFEFERLASMLRARKQEIGAWKRFAEELAEANPLDERFHIGRKLLKNLAEEDNSTVAVKVGQLVALDKYFTARKQRPLLVKGITLIDSIAESNHVNFLVGSRKVPRRRDLVVSHHDLRATTYLTRSRLGQKKYETWDVNGPDHWNSIVTRIGTGANVAIGSSVSNYAAEATLCAALDIEPYKKHPVSALPFFIVGADRDRGNPSAFVRNNVDATRVDAEEAKKLAKARRSLAFGGRLYATSKQHDYALLVAQRNPVHGQIRLILFGLTGRGTYQLARILQGDHLQQTVPEHDVTETHPPILVALYRLVLESDEENSDFEGKKVVNYSAEERPMLLRFRKGKWCFPDNFRQSK